MIKQLIAAAALALAGLAPAHASEGGFPLDRAPNRINNLAALQNGAKLFVNYCLNCHSANSMRYNKLTEIGLTEDQIRDNLLFTGDKVGDLMRVAMTPADAKKWLGIAPPDLSVIARAKSVNAGPSGADYIYTYLRTFYRDASRPTGWNNLVFPSAGMPHALWDRQGPRELTTVAMQAGEKGAWSRVTTVYDAQGIASVKTEPVAQYHGHASVDARFKALDPARSAAFDSEAADLTAFMTWMAEPVQQYRARLGVWVLLFLGLFLVIAWRMNAAYWKHVR
jgi:ubiquinol-cytochrome c reductase cytochrome c1 subunit